MANENKERCLQCKMHPPMEGGRYCKNCYEDLHAYTKRTQPAASK